MENTLSRLNYLALIGITLFIYAGISHEIRANSRAETILPSLQQQVTGVVTDENGLPIPGVAISIKDSSTGTTSDLEGRYSISVGSQDVLVITYLGMVTKEEPVNGRSEINIMLEEDVTALGEVEINAGYYYTTRRESTGNISRVTAEEIELQPVISPIQALQGRMAGVEIIPRSGLPGAASTIRIRGTNSLREDGNYPLYIIDGVPVNSAPLETGSIIAIGMDPLNNFDLSSIESIEILKDADATAIYGSRGANGVVLITTKKGSSGKTEIQAQVYTGASTVPNRVNLLNTDQYLQIRRQAFENDGVEPTLFNGYDLVQFDQDRYTDWQDFLFGGTSNTTNYQIAASGGTANTTFRLGGSYFNQGSVHPGEAKYQKAAGNLNLSHISTNQRLKINLAVNYGVDNNELMGTYSMIYRAFTLPPNAPAIFTNDGNLNWEDWTAVGLANPLEGFFNNSNTQHNSFITSAAVSYQLFDGLQVKANMGYNHSNSNDLVKRPKKSLNPALWQFIDHSSSHLFSYRKSWIVEPQLVYEKNIGKSQLSTIIGATFQESEAESTRFQAQGYVSEALIGTLGAADNIINGTSQFADYRYNALFGRIGYNWNKEFYINLTGRRDGSSRFGPGKKMSNFWAAGGAWIFLQDQDNTFLSFGKIRGSYGTTGNDQIGDYGYLDAYEATVGPGGLYPTQLANPAYSWEENKKLEAAIELSFLQDHLNVGVSWFRNRSSNQLVGYSLPSTTGFSSIQANLPATVQNSGLEMVLTSTNFESKDFSWETSLNISIPDNKLVSYPELEQSTYANTYRVGHPLNISLLYQFDGIDPETGLYMIKDINNDGRFNYDDRVVIQDYGKQIFGGINNNIRYKNISLQFLWDFVKQDGSFHLFDAGAIGNQHEMVLEAMDANDYFQEPSSSSAARTAFSRALSSTLPVQDASFLRLKTLTLTYSVSNRVLNIFGLKGANIFFNGHNLLTLTKYKGLDPEYPRVGDSFNSLRTISGGLTLIL